MSSMNIEAILHGYADMCERHGGVYDIALADARRALAQYEEKVCAQAFDEGVWAAHDRLHRYVHKGVIDQHMLIKTPPNPYKQEES